MLESIKGHPSLPSILINLKLLDILPCGLSIATDVSCETIIHNTTASNFLRIEPFSVFSLVAKEPPPVKIYEQGRLLRPEEMPMHQAAWYGKEIRSCTLEFVWEDGIAKIARCSATPLRDKEGIITGCIATMEDISDEISNIIFRDISERKKVEEALRLSEEKFAKAFYHNQTMMAITKVKDGAYLDVNDKYAAGLGFQREEMIGKSGLELGVWAELKDRENMFQQLAEYGFFRSEVKFRSKSGETGYAVANVNVLDLGGEPCLLNSAINITEQKKIEEDLRTSKELFYKTFNANPLPMSITTKNGMRVEVNESYLKRHGYTKEEVIGFTLAEKNIWVDIKKRDKYIAEIEGKGFVENYETMFYNESGEIKNVLLSGVLITWNNEQCILSIGNDITELRRYQQEMARLDSLNLVGEMAAGIGHEIRNPMTTVRGFLQLLGAKERYAPDKEFMDLMIEELDRANAIITEYLTLAKNKTVELKKQSLNQKVRRILPLIQADAMKQDKSIKVELNAIPYIVIDRNEIKQLILNLVRNGLEAMPPGGLLTIKTLQADGQVVLAVQDQGTGIAPEVLEKIGTPFFTTKENGTGLGLAVCYSIAQRNNAKIDIETSAGGTTFYVRFKAKSV